MFISPFYTYDEVRAARAHFYAPQKLISPSLFIVSPTTDTELRKSYIKLQHYDAPATHTGVCIAIVSSMLQGVWDMCLSLKNGTFLEHYASRLGYKALPGNQPQLVMVTPLSKRQRNEDLDPDGSLWTPKLMDNLVIELDAAHAAHPQCGVLVVVRLSDELLGWTPPPRMVATSEGTQKEQRHLNRFTNLQVWLLH